MCPSSYSTTYMVRVVVISSDSPVFENGNIAISIIVLSQERIDAWFTRLLIRMTTLVCL